MARAGYLAQQCLAPQARKHPKKAVGEALLAQKELSPGLVETQKELPRHAKLAGHKDETRQVSGVQENRRIY